MSSGGAAGVVTMKAAFPQSGSQLQKQHSQSILQSTSTFDQQIQLQQHQQHLLQQQQLQHSQNQHAAQLHRLSQPHISSAVHSAQSVAQSTPTNHTTATHSSVFSNAEFFQTLQQTAAAAALPTVLPYDQSQYIGQLMYFPYSPAAAAAANGLFSATTATDAHHMSVCSAAPGTQATIINQATGNAGQLLGSAGIVSATPSGMVALNSTGTTGHVQNASHLFASGAGIVGLGTPGSSGVSVSNTMASASLAPLFTTAHFYPQHHTHPQAGQQQLQLQHHLQHHTHASVPMHHVQTLANHTGLHLQQQAQQPTAATVLLSGSVSSTSQASMVSTQQNHPTAHSTPQPHPGGNSNNNNNSNNNSANSNNNNNTNNNSNNNKNNNNNTGTSTNNNGNNNNSAATNGNNNNHNNNSNGTNNNGNSTSTTTTNNNNNNNNGIGGNCENLQKGDDNLQSTPAHTPQKQNDQDLLSQSNQLGTPSQGNNSSLDASSTTIKRDNSGTGHFVCSVCGREFGMRCRLIAHTRRHTGERPFPCADCGRAFSDRGNLQRHRFTHSSQPRFHCTVCGKSFRQASCLSNHRRFHCAGATGRPCPFCQRSFRSSSSLQMHIRWKHRADAAAAVRAAINNLPGLSSYVPAVTMNGVPTMALNGTNIEFQNSSLLSAAAAVSAAMGNHGVVPGASVGSVLDSVLNSNSNNGSPNKRKWRRKPKPKQAQNAFGKLTGDGLNILASINLSEGIDVNAAAAAAGAAAAAVGGPVPLDRKGRPCNYPCPACPRRFAFQCRLAAHLRCHTNIRPFICIDCGRAFTQRGYLVRHAAVHKLDRPFSCGLCDRSYKHYGSLVNHRRTHSKGSALGLLSNSAMNLGTLNSMGTLSSLEEVVGGALGQTHKTDASEPSGGSSAPTTITLLPVSKVEEILPGDLNSSVQQQVCLPSVACASETQEQRDAENAHSHQLTAVWPLLATGGINHVSQAHLVPSSVQQSRQGMVPGSHFSTITISPQLTQSTQQQQLPIVGTRSQVTQSNTVTMLSAAASSGTPTFVTVPLFSGQSQNLNESDSSVNGQLSSINRQFHCPTSTLSDSNQIQQSHHQLTQQLQHNQNTTQANSVSGDSNTAPVLHVLQPSPSIFFSPYYLPHSAASQM